MYNRRVLPSVGPLCGVLPRHRLIAFVRERRRLLNWDGRETSGLLCGNIPSEVDHQWLGFARALINQLHAYIPFPFLELQTSIRSLSTIPCSNYSAIGHVSTSCDAPSCIKQEFPLSPLSQPTLRREGDA